MPSQGVTNVANAIINKINNLISSHNNNSNAHQDIRESIPSATSELNNNSGFITSSSIPSASNTTPSADTTNGTAGTGTAWARSDHTHPKSSLYAESTHAHSDADITTLGFYGNLPQANYENPSQRQVNSAINSAMGSKEDNANKVTRLSGSSTDTQYPSAKCVYDTINDNGFITSSQIINNDNLCDYKTLIPFIDEGESISDVSFEDYDFDIMFTINPNIEESDCQGEMQIGDSSFILIGYVSPDISVFTPSGETFEFNRVLDMTSENTVKIKQDQSTNDFIFTINNQEMTNIENDAEISKNIGYIQADIGTISNFGVKACTRIMTEVNSKQECYFDGDDFVIMSNESTITKTLTIIWDDNNNARGLRPRYLQATISNITAYLSEESDWSVSVPVDTEDTYNWSVQSVLRYNAPVQTVVDNLTTVTFRIRTQPTPPTPSEPV